MSFFLSSNQAINFVIKMVVISCLLLLFIVIYIKLFTDSRIRFFTLSKLINLPKEIDEHNDEILLLLSNVDYDNHTTFIVTVFNKKWTITSMQI